MILGRGSARTEKAIFAEYKHFLDETGEIENATIRERLQEAPGVMRRRIGKPLAQWSEADLSALYRTRTKTVRYTYSAFLTFLLFRGYRWASLAFLLELNLDLTRYHRRALAPFRRKLEQIQAELGYWQKQVGSELHLLLLLLVVVHKPLEELTRPEFDAFRDEYQRWHRQSPCHKSGKPNYRLSRLERYLVHCGMLSAALRIFRHEEHFARVRHAPIRTAILTFVKWCETKYQPSTLHSRRAALLHFFLWFQAQHPTRRRLDEVTRASATEHLNAMFAPHLNQSALFRASDPVSPKF